MAEGHLRPTDLDHGRAALPRLSLNCSSGRESAPISYEIPRIVSRLTSAATIKWGFETVSAPPPYRDLV
jgi:hypothetical protein